MCSEAYRVVNDRCVCVTTVTCLLQDHKMPAELPDYNRKNV